MARIKIHTEMGGDTYHKPALDMRMWRGKKMWLEIARFFRDPIMLNNEWKSGIGFTSVCDCDRSWPQQSHRLTIFSIVVASVVHAAGRKFIDNHYSVRM